MRGDPSPLPGSLERLTPYSTGRHRTRNIGALRCAKTETPGNYYGQADPRSMYVNSTVSAKPNSLRGNLTSRGARERLEQELAGKLTSRITAGAPLAGQARAARAPDAPWFGALAK